VDDDHLSVLRQMHIQLARLRDLPTFRECGQRVLGRCVGLNEALPHAAMGDDLNLIH
jgi:hypothetical protein